MSDCQHAGKWFGGCNFEPRYDEYAPDQALRDCVKYADGEVPAYVVKMLSRKTTYVCDICTRCGKTIERSKP
jgi:hypothetical protein